MALYVWSQLAAFALQSSTVVLPPGYQRAIIYNLAVELSLSPRFVRSKLDPGVAALAKQYKGELGQLNAIPGYGEAPTKAAA